MNESDALRNLLERLGQDYARREIAVTFSDQPRITPDGEQIYVWSEPSRVLGVDIGKGQEFRLIRNALNHEAAHDRWSDLKGKARFAARYPNHRETAGNVLNILEDSYIDHRRLNGPTGQVPPTEDTRHWPGLKGAQAVFADTQLERDVSELPTDAALITCIHQYALAGRVNGIQNADQEVREFAAWVKPHIDAVRRHDDPHEREAIAARVMDHLIEYLPEKASDMSQDAKDALDEAEKDITGEVPDAFDVDDVEPSDFDPDEMPDELPDEMPEPPESADQDTEAEDYRDNEADETDQDGEGQGEGQGETTEETEAEDTEGEGGEAAEDPEADQEAEPDAGGQGDPEADEDSQDAPEADPETEGQASDENQEASEAGETAEDSPTSGEGDSEAETDQEDSEIDEDLRDHLDELDDRDERGESPEHHGIDPDSDDWQEPSKFDEKKAEQVAEQAKRNQTEMGRRENQRDYRINQHRHERDADPSKIREIMRQSGIARDIRMAFERFATADETVESTHGNRLNLDGVVRHLSGDYSERNLYERTKTADTGGRLIGLCVDSSGSMNDRYSGSDFVNEHCTDTKAAIVDAKMAIGAFQLAAHELGDEICINAFRDNETMLVTGPNEAFEWDHLDSIFPANGTPTAKGIMDNLAMLEDRPAREKVMIVLTDGQPTSGHPDIDSSDIADRFGIAHLEAKADAAVAVNTARARGINVVGVGVGDGVDEDQMAKIFGRDGYLMTDTDDLVGDLIELYRGMLDYEGTTY